jgi:hypothetical protein
MLGVQVELIQVPLVGMNAVADSTHHT